MVSKFTLLSSLLLASAALAAPSSLVEAPLARGREDHRSRSINHTMSLVDDPPARKVEESRYLAGAYLVESPVRIIPMVYDHVRSHSFCCRQGTFTRITAKFNVPRLWRYGGNISVWVGIDDASHGTYLWTGVTMTFAPVPVRETNYTGERRRASTLN